MNRRSRRSDEEAEPTKSAGAAGDSPPSLTGGVESSARAKVDWMTVTWLPDTCDASYTDQETGEIVFVRDEHHVAASTLAFLQGLFGGVEGVSCPGMFGYASGVRFFLSVHGTPCHIGRLDFGGSHHKGRARLDLYGSGCGVVPDFERVVKWIGQQFDAHLTRVDLAVDCLMGEYGVEDAVAWYKAGDFKAATSGRQPRHSLVGDWLDPVHGRTLEVGRRENGKMCRVYEKGRQLGDPSSLWTRFEVEIRNEDRELPLSMLTEPDRYFVGAYRCLQRVLAVAGDRIQLNRREAEVAIAKLTLHAREAYGQLIDVLRLKLSASEVLDALSRPGIPGRLQKSSLAEYYTAENPAAFLKAKVEHEAQRDRL